MGWLYAWALLFVISPAWAVFLFIPMVILALFVDTAKTVAKEFRN